MEVYGLIGEKLSHSMSPDIFNILFNKYSLKGTYSTFEIDKANFLDTITSLKTLNIKGANVTIPYKIDIIGQLDSVDDSVNKIGACNCIKIDEGIARGFNTDYYGVKDAFEFNNVDVKDKRCVVLGSGGASKSVIALLQDLNAKSITVVQRVKDDYKNDYIKYINYDELKDIDNSYLLVNTTPVGMFPNVDKSPVDIEILHKFEVCFDAVYNPIDTKFLVDAKSLELQTIDGLYMLVGQAINAFTIFNGIEVEKEEFISIYKEVLSLLKQKI